MIPAEFHAADDVGPEVVLDRGGDFFTLAVRGPVVGSHIGVNALQVKILATEIEREFVGGFDRGIETEDPATVILGVEPRDYAALLALTKSNEAPT